MTELTHINRSIMEDFIDLFMARLQVRAAFEKHVAVDYRQHSPQFGEGREATIVDLERQFASFPAPRITVKHMAVEGNFAFVHLHGRASEDDPGIAGVDIFRLDAGKIVEHWDVVQPVVGETKSGRSMI